MMIQSFDSGGAIILYAEINEPVHELTPQLVNFEAYRNEFENVRNEKRQKEFLASRILINKLHPQPQKINYTAEGKPYIENSDVNISISHSGNRVTVIAHPTCNVGIDIEKSSPRIVKLAGKFLNNDELSEFSNDQEQMILAWSVKEALYKIIGTGAADFKQTLHIFPFDAHSPSGRIEAKYLPNNKIYKLSFFKKEEFNIAFCID